MPTYPFQVVLTCTYMFLVKEYYCCSLCMHTSVFVTLLQVFSQMIRCNTEEGLGKSMLWANQVLLDPTNSCSLARQVG